MKKHNFSAGPSILPKDVIQKSAEGILNINGSNLSLIEISHRSKDFVEIMNSATSLALELLNLENKGYKALFLQGGASMQFLMTAYNLLENKAGYINTGAWSTKALKEAKNFGNAIEIASSKNANFNYIPKNYSIDEDLDYLHITTNNTIFGTQYHEIPETKNNLISDELDISQVITERKAVAHKILSKYSISLQSYKKLWINFNEDYFSRFDGKDIAWHTRVLLPYSKNQKSIVKVRHSSDGQGIEVLIFTKDAEALFAKITNFFYNIKCDVVQATISTTKNNYALDVFNLIDTPNESISYKHYFQHIEKELTSYLLDKHSKLNIPVTKKTAQATFHKIESQITCKKIKSNRYQLEVICASRPNLLGLIVKEINLLEMSVHNAKINTLGQRAEDFFIISSKIKLNLENRIEMLIKNIRLKVDE